MNMVKIVRIDGKVKPISDFKDTTYHPEIINIGGCEFPVFNVPEPFARHMISQRPQWYKLYDSKPLSCPIEDPKNGSRKYVLFNPWKLKVTDIVAMKNGAIVKDEKGKEVIKKSYEWVEDTK